MRHHDGTEHAHDDQHASVGESGRDPTRGGRTPVDMRDTDFEQERQPDQGNKADDDFSIFL